MASVINNNIVVATESTVGATGGAPIVTTPPAPIAKTREELLKNCFEIQRDKWEHLCKSMQIRIQCADGQLLSGGFIVDIIGTTDLTRVFKLGNFPKIASRSPGYKELVFKWVDIVHLWKRCDRFSYLEVSRTQMAVMTLLDRNRALEAKVAGLETVISRIISDMKKKSI